ncbi:MAG: helix-hairpin-helix domain-containing protein [Thermoplasmata archaeon]|nr:helix-hairpin-helix domain-containing protein [Thermoplasmata archaeon]MCI4359289.1 helix-hairpin-helix domain-containing protein [Thermoplasmata archaeon]
MSVNVEVSEVLLGIADLLELKSERFKPEAYRRAARSILGAGEDLRTLRQNDLLGAIPGVGEAIRRKIEEYLDSGKVEYYERLKQEIPPGVLALMRIPGVGPKTASRFYRELGIDSPAALLDAIGHDRLSGVAGFGPRKIQNLRRDLEKASGTVARRLPLRTAWAIAQGVVRAIVAAALVDQVEIAGSLRRRRESVGDIDILATSGSPGAAIETFAKLPGVRQIVVKGETKCTVILDPGIQVDLRVVPPESFGAALQYFTGSKDHNVRLRTWARERGLKINEYGVLRGEVRVAGATEEEVYRALDLPWIPPEIRENQGELDGAALGRVPSLVNLSDLRGELHQHLLGSDGELSEMAAGATRQGLQYVGVVLPGPHEGTDWTRRVRRLRSEWPAKGGPAAPRLLVGYEAPLGEIEAMRELPPGVDYLVGLPGDGTPRPPAPAPTERVPFFPWFLGHLRFATDPSEPIGERASPWIEWGRNVGVALEVTPDGPMDGLDSGSIRRAVDAGTSLVLSAGSKAVGDFADLELSIGLARRGWTHADRILNAAPDPASGRPTNAR